MASLSSTRRGSTLWAAAALLLTACGVTVRAGEPRLDGASSDRALDSASDATLVEPSRDSETPPPVDPSLDSGNPPTQPDVIIPPEAAIVESDGGTIDPGSVTSRVEVAMFGDAAAFSESALTLVSLRALFGGGALRTFTRAMVPSPVCTAQQIGPCAFAACSLNYPPTERSSGVISVTNSGMRITSPPDTRGRYNQVGPSSPMPYNLEARTLVTASGGPTIAPWAASVAVPGFAPFAREIPPEIDSTQPLPLRFGAPSRSAGKRAALVQSPTGLSMLCVFDPGAPTVIPSEALSTFRSSRTVRITPAAIEEVLVPVMDERVLVSTTILTTSSAQSIIR